MRQGLPSPPCPFQRSGQLRCSTTPCATAPPTYLHSAGNLGAPQRRMQPAKPARGAAVAAVSCWPTEICKAARLQAPGEAWPRGPCLHHACIPRHVRTRARQARPRHGEPSPAQHPPGQLLLAGSPRKQPVNQGMRLRRGQRAARAQALQHQLRLHLRAEQGGSQAALQPCSEGCQAGMPRCRWQLTAGQARRPRMQPSEGRDWGIVYQRCTHRPPPSPPHPRPPSPALNPRNSYAPPG